MRGILGILLIVFAGAASGAPDAGAPAAAPAWVFRASGIGSVDAERADPARPDADLVIGTNKSAWRRAELAALGGTWTCASWLVGPPAAAYGDRHGNPAYYFKVDVRRPDGAASLHGPFGFAAAGHGLFPLPWRQLADPTGRWVVRWILWDRDADGGRVVATEILDILP